MDLTINNREKLLSFFLEITDNDKKEIAYIKNLLDVYPNILDYMVANKTPDLSEVKYVKYKRYNLLKDKVLDNYELLRLNGMLNDAFSISTLQLLRKHYSNKLEDSDVNINNLIVKHIKTKPYDTLCNLNGIAFIKADKILLDAYTVSKDIWDFDLRSSKYRCTCFILWFLINCLNGSTYVDINRLKQALYKYNLSECMSSFYDSLKDKRLTLIDNDKVTLTSVFLEEQNISNFIKRSLNPDYQTNWNIDIENYRQIENFNLSDEQINTLKLVNQNQFVLLNGYAGTGKSSSIKALINMLEDNNKSYVILAPTAKAAKQISFYTERPASTIHYLLCSDFPDFDSNTSDKSEYDIVSDVDSFYITELGVLNYDCIIIDECSMLSVQLFNILLRYINPKRNKLLMIGDSYQLPSIQRGNLYQDLLTINEIPKVTLNEIFRYKENGLVNVATNIRYGNKYLNSDVEQLIGDSYYFHDYEDVKDMLNAALNKYVELYSEGNSLEDTAILTAKNIGNSGTNLVNSCIQKIINPIDEFDEFIGIKVDNQTIRFKENDLVMNIKNNYNAKSLKTNEKKLLANGQIGRVKYVNSFNNSMVVEIDDDTFEFEYGDICNLRLAYCFTVHKSQGSQFKNVIFLTTREDTFMINSNILYVAITRAKEKCFHYGSKFVVNLKVNEQENLKRNTTLCDQFYNKYNICI